MSVEICSAQFLFNFDTLLLFKFKKGAFVGQTSKPWGRRHHGELMAVITNEASKYGINIGYYRTKVIRNVSYILRIVYEP